MPRSAAKALIVWEELLLNMQQTFYESNALTPHMASSVPVDLNEKLSKLQQTYLKYLELIQLTNWYAKILQQNGWQLGYLNAL